MVCFHDSAYLRILEQKLCWSLRQEGVSGKVLKGTSVSWGECSISEAASAFLCGFLQVLSHQAMCEVAVDCQQQCQGLLLEMLRYLQSNTLLYLNRKHIKSINTGLLE